MKVKIHKKIHSSDFILKKIAAMETITQQSYMQLIFSPHKTVCVLHPPVLSGMNMVQRQADPARHRKLDKLFLRPALKTATH